MKKQIDVTDFAKKYGFVMPVKIDSMAWQKCIGRGLRKLNADDQEFDYLALLLMTCSNYIKNKHNGSKTDVLFDFKGNTYGIDELNIQLESELEFDRKNQPYILIKLH